MDRRTASLAAAALVAVLALVAVTVVSGAARDDRPTAVSAHVDGRNLIEPGRLVFLARSDGAGASLWVVDLVAGTVRRGPSVPATTGELVDASAAGSGWIGLERHGRRRAIGVFVAQGIARGAELAELGRGDLVAWGPGGSSLVIARNGAGRGTCSPVRISLLTIRTQRVEWALDDPGLCGPVLSLSRSAAATYFTARSGDRLGVYLTGKVGAPYLLFGDAVMVSGSSLGGFLLGPVEDRRTHGEASVSFGWNGIGGPVPIGRGDVELWVGRVLTWSPDGSRVALVGTLGTDTGVFVVDAGPGTGQREPIFVTPKEVLDATFDRRGSLYLSTRQGLFAYRDGALVRVPLPERAPAPAGPVVWTS